MKAGAWRLDLYRLAHRPWRALGIVVLIGTAKTVLLLAALAGAFGPLENGFAFWALSGTYTVYLLSFLLFLLAAGSLANEYARGLLRMHLARPVSRCAYFTDRLVFFTLLAFLLLFIDALTGALAGWAGFGFSDAADVRLQGPQFGAEALAWGGVKAYGLTFLGLAGLTATGLVVSLLCKTPSAALGSAAAVFFLLEGLRVIFREPLACWLVVRYNRIHLERLSEITRGIAGYTAPETVVQAVGIPLAYWLIALIIGSLLFRRLEILE